MAMCGEREISSTLGLMLQTKRRMTRFQAVPWRSNTLIKSLPPPLLYWACWSLRVLGESRLFLFQAQFHRDNHSETLFNVK
jgi:hypothetical protein